MKSVLAAVLCFLMPPSVFAVDTSYKVTYDGGSLPDLKTGTGLHLDMDQDKVRFVDSGKEIATVPASAITEISYGQDVHRRVGAAIGVAMVSFGIGALMALTKSKQHFVGLTWADGDKKRPRDAVRQKRISRDTGRTGRYFRQKSRRFFHDNGEESSRRGIRLLIGDVSDSNECSEVENSRIEVVTLVVAKTAILI